MEFMPQLLSTGIITTLIGVGYKSLIKRMDSTSAQVYALQIDVTNVRIDVGAIKEQQKAMNGRVNRAEDEIKEIRYDIKKVV